MTEEATVEAARIDIGRSEPLASSAEASAVSKVDRYELRRPLGECGFATVYEGYDPRIKRMVAIKRCSSLDQENHERFFCEAEIAGNLSHANIVRIFDFGVADGIPFRGARREPLSEQGSRFRLIRRRSRKLVRRSG